MTAQIHEKLIFEGEESSMAFCPPIPDDHPRIRRLSLEEMQKERTDLPIFSTACWRGYVGTWELREGLFYLLGLTGRYKLIGDGPLLADWFSGVIRIPRGNLLHYVHMGFGSVYEEEIHVKIERGEVTASRIVDNRGKDVDPSDLGWRNLPGSENRFEGDEEL